MFTKNWKCAVALLVVGLLAGSASAASIGGTTYTYLQAPSICNSTGSLDSSFVGGVYGSGYLNNGAAGDQDYLDGDPWPNAYDGNPARAWQIEGDAAFNGGYTCVTGTIYYQAGATNPLPIKFDLGASYDDLSTVTLSLAQYNAHGIGLPKAVTISDGTNEVVDTSYADVTATMGPMGRGEYETLVVDISSLSGQFVTISLGEGNSQWDSFVAITEVSFETAGEPIPEPGTLVLLAAGLVGLLCYAWRKRK